MTRNPQLPLRTMLAGLFMAAASFGTAQADAPAEKAAAAYVYDISQSGQTLGETAMTVQHGPDGYTTHSSVSVAGIFQAENSLQARPDGSALAYTIQGTAQGAAFQIDVAFTDAGADLTISQGGATQSLSLPSETPFYVFDNNFLEGFQLGADQVIAAGEERVFAALVPQTATVATLGFQAPKPGTVEYRGDTLDATEIDVAFAVAGQTLAIKLYLDDAGHILVLEQQPGNVRFERRIKEAPTTEGAEGAAAADDLGAIATAEAALQANAHCVVEQEVTVASTGATLFGRLTLPVSATLEGGRPAPTVLILPGSGAVDMDGNSLPYISNAVYKQLAFELACNGYGALRVAKLGVAPSTGDGNAVTLSTYAENTADWLATLAEQPGVDPRRLALLGHSEGGLVALYTVAEGYAQPAVVITVASPGRPMDVLLREQLVASFERAGLAGEQLAAMTRQSDEAIEAVWHAEGPTLALDGGLAGNQIAASFAHAAGLLRSEFEQDPALLAAKVQVPALVLQGLKDVQVLQVDGRALAGALPRGTLLEFADLGHSMNLVPGAPESGMLPSPDAVLSGTLAQSLVTWLNGHLRTAR